MSGPKYTVTAETIGTKEGGTTIVSRNPSFCVAFVRFNNPSSILSGRDDAMKERKLLVVENDCVQVSVDAPKNGFAKTASITLKIGEIYYQNAVSPGDYVFIWMANYQDDIEGILDLLLPKDAGTKGFGPSDVLKLNGWNSGLKFFGRVMSPGAVDSISVNGIRTMVQHISCQAFVELASSVYYTFVAQNVLTVDQKLDNQTAATNFYEKELAKLSSDQKKLNKNKPSVPPKGVSNGMETALSKFSSAFNNFYRRVDGKDAITGDTSPEAIIGLMFILTMGVESKGSFANSLSEAIPGAKGQFSDAIGIPKSAANILGKPKAKKLWQVYNLYLGLQEYSTGHKTVYEAFSPKFTSGTDKNNNVLYRTPTKCKGYIPFMLPPIWDNNSFWNIYNQFLNPVVNEMYTALRINKFGNIAPTLIVREKPFSTNLYHYILKKAPLFTEEQKDKAAESKAVEAIKKAASDNNSEVKVPNYSNLNKVSQELNKRTYYNNLPRWIIDESVIKSVNVAASESNRINFVQVWGRSRASELLGLNISQELLKVAQFNIPNYVADERDIARHGLRADITESNYDVSSEDLGTISHLLARMRADWMFNGQLKTGGTITLEGVQEPICEGDNCEVRGVLFHIESVHHEASVSATGHKSFQTVLTVSNGIIAKSLDTGKGIPHYPSGDQKYQYTESLNAQNNHPGITDIQMTGKRKNRNDAGET